MKVVRFLYLTFYTYIVNKMYILKYVKMYFIICNMFKNVTLLYVTCENITKYTLKYNEIYSLFAFVAFSTYPIGYMPVAYYKSLECVSRPDSLRELTKSPLKSQKNCETFRFLCLLECVSRLVL